LGIIKVINNVINDVFFFIFSLILDIIVLNGISDYIKSKKKMMENFKEQEEQKKKKRIQKMVFINGIIFVLSHLPELISSVYLLIYENKWFFCIDFKCDKLNELAQFFIYFSIISQFFINKNFNNLFKESYDQIVARIKRKFNNNK
jgi:hypothetical protein